MMKIPLVDLKAQYHTLKSEIDRAIESVISDAAFIGNLSNKYVAEFERAFAEFVGVPGCVACGNGTDSLEIILKAAGIGAGDEVLVPAVSWIATSEAVSNVGAKPVFVDIYPEDNTLNVEQAATLISGKTKAIIPVHLYGHPAQMNKIMALAQKHNLFVLEDCAQAHGARFRGQMVGTIGHAGSFSFFPGKNLGAYGDAGGIVSNDEALLVKARMIAQHGQSKGKHDHRIEGRNSRLDGIQAAILTVKLPHLETWTKQRQMIHEMYNERLKGLGIGLPIVAKEVHHVFHLYVVRVRNRDHVHSRLNSRGIGATIQYPCALPLLSAYMHRGHTKDEFPVAAQLTAECMSLPIFPELTEEQIIHVAAEMKSAIQ
jgi:dTDP-4-amino-4,6-dideoxygalactose transaminase